MMRWTIISGTNRPQSNTRKLSNYIAERLKTRVDAHDKIEIIDLLQLPSEIFRPEAYAERPASFQSFQDIISNSDAVISVLPEYNGSAPGVYKYFIDMLSFPESLAKKPAAFIGLAAGRFGALRSIEQMQQVFLYRNAYLYPESVYVKEVGKLMDANGKPKDPFVLELTETILDGFVSFARRLKD